MADHAVSSDPDVQAQLDRLTMLSPGRDVLGLSRISALLDRLGRPQDHLPPVFHVAGTNGKGSTTAFLRAMLEASGHRVHVYTSPHLVRFNERIRIAGRLIDDATLATLLAEVLDGSADIAPSFFEATTAAAFLAFARTPADACIIEVGLGGRLDATNVIDHPLVCGIASLGIDHAEFLLSADGDVPPMPDLERIAFEKAGVAKRGAPLVTLDYAPAVAARIAGVADAAGATLVMRGRHWTSSPIGRGFVYSDRHGKIYADAPALPGAHQQVNAGLAVAMLRHQSRLTVPETAINTGLARARWPARMQRLGDGPLTRRLAAGTALWLDGGHNLDAATALAQHLSTLPGPVDIVIGMLANKDAAGFLHMIGPHVAALVAVPIPGHAHHAPEALAGLARAAGIAAATSATDLPAALDRLGGSKAVAIVGSLYLAGMALALNEELPD